MRAYRIKLGWLGGKEELPISSPFGPRKPPTAGASSMHKGIKVCYQNRSGYAHRQSSRRRTSGSLP